MWTLWIVSIVFATADMAEYKYTRYDEFNSKLECQVAWHKITTDFTQGEAAFCDGEDK